jgi:hypothetical protein
MTIVTCYNSLKLVGKKPPNVNCGTYSMKNYTTREQNSDTHNTDESQKHFVKQTETRFKRGYIA